MLKRAKNDPFFWKSAFFEKSGQNPGFLADRQNPKILSRKIGLFGGVHFWDPFLDP